MTRRNLSRMKLTVQPRYSLNTCETTRGAPTNGRHYTAQDSPGSASAHTGKEGVQSLGLRGQAAEAREVVHQVAQRRLDPVEGEAHLHAQLLLASQTK